MADRRIQPNALTTRNSRFALGGTTELNGDALGWWERVSTDSLKNISEEEWDITPEYIGRPDLIAYRFYQTVSLAWLILLHNNIIDAEEELVVGATLLIPDAARVKLGIASLKASDTVKTI